MSDTFQRAEEKVVALLLAACTKEWQPSSRVIGNAMVLHYRKYRDGIGDLFLEERMREFALSPGLFDIDDANRSFGQYNGRIARQPQA